MKKSKFYKAVILSVTITSYFPIAYLILRQIHNHNFLIENACVIFILSFINLLNILIYFNTKYYITKDFFFKTKYKHKEDVILERCKRIFTKKEKLADKRIRYSFTLLHICLLTVGFWALAQYHFNIHGDISSYYYEKQLELNYMFLILAMLLTIITFLLFSLHTTIVMLKKNKYFKSHERCLSNVYTLSPPLISTDDTTLKLLSTPRSSLSSCDTPQLISLLPSPTPSSGVFSFPSISPSPTLKVEVHSVSFLVEDIMPKLLDAPKPSSSGIGTSIKSSQISKSKVSLSSGNVSIISESSLLFSLRKAKSWPHLYKEELSESIFPASADDIMQQTPSTPREWTLPSSPSTFSSSSTFTPYLTSSSDSNNLRFLGLSPSLSPGSCMYSIGKF
ncbi:MAG: hypothetical protein sL5_00450 [Candidatus Mesenet longicola]|uniref:Uncharacterized protein n=1 Tax=Candidatus Mesenet longicola TaxID=1892558 RepID=A0A8J3MQ09_9RICK|nr:MAG: hypothetical protein sGL2_00510 [Candidatus Mesenet longicola]GHM59052.1 MAG: hypothetical protein sL5_00450 [Candidatus Mesenet longicola]